MDWRHHAECRDEDPELFFAIGTTGPALLQIAEAKTVCQRCPVNSECLSWALASGQDAGVWGGMSEDERRAIKRRNARTGTTDPPPERSVLLTGLGEERRTCTGCKQPKPLGAFGRDKQRPDGVTLRCRACKSSAARVSQRRIREQSREVSA